MSLASDYWNILYSENINECVNRVNCVAKDFFKQVKKHGLLADLFAAQETLLEFGCGTGEFGMVLTKEFPQYKYTGIDISDFAIEFANKEYSSDVIKFVAVDLFEVTDRFDIVFSSNTLEHFKDPFRVIDRMLSLSKYTFLLVPYNQKELTDGYNTEGGAGHVFCFNENTMSRYNMFFDCKYFTHTWVHGDNPLQWLIVLKSDENTESWVP